MNTTYTEAAEFGELVPGLQQHEAPVETRRADQDVPELPSPAAFEHLGLSIGTRLGIRPTIGMGATMHASRVIGFAPNRALFVMLPLKDGRPLAFERGEQLELVAMSSRAVFMFVCTVDAICKSPFPYLVLSEPGAIRRLRMRRSVRVHAKLAVRYAVKGTDSGYEGLGVTHDISPLGMSLAASAELGQVGDSLRIAFRITIDDVNFDIATTAAIKSVKKSPASDGLTIHGLKFAGLEPMQQIALKCYVLDRNQTASLYPLRTEGGDR